MAPLHRHFLPKSQDIRRNTIIHSRSVDPQKLRIGVKYYIVHMYSMSYYTYGSTADFLVLGPTALIVIYIYQNNGAVTKIERVIE